MANHPEEGPRDVFEGIGGYAVPADLWLDQTGAVVPEETEAVAVYDLLTAEAGASMGWSAEIGSTVPTCST